jgi:hypothetical protein
VENTRFAWLWLPGSRPPRLLSVGQDVVLAPGRTLHLVGDPAASGRAGNRRRLGNGRGGENPGRTSALAAAFLAPPEAALPDAPAADAAVTDASV